MGPLSEADVRELLVTRRLGWTDLAIAEGGTSWQAVIEIAVFASRGDFPEPGAKWIVRSSQTLMLGPYSTERVIEKLARGELSYSHLVWTEESGAWRRVGDCVEFGGTAEIAQPVHATDVPMDVGDVLSAIGRAGEMSSGGTEGVPEGAMGEDLVGNLPWMKTILQLAAVSIAAFVSYQASAASVIEIVPLKLTSAAPQLVFQTDATRDEAIVVRIAGASGEILDLPSYRNELSIRRQAGEVPSLNLADLRLPKGTYRVEAAVGEVKSEATIFVGQRDEEFEKARIQHVKFLAEQQQAEKMALFYSARKMAGLAKRLASNVSRSSVRSASWKAFYLGFKKDLNAARRPVDDLIQLGEKRLAYPEQLVSFRNAVLRLEKVAGEQDALAGRGRELASLSEQPKSIGSEFEELQKRAAELSSAP